VHRSSAQDRSLGKPPLGPLPESRETYPRTLVYSRHAKLEKTTPTPPPKTPPPHPPKKKKKEKTPNPPPHKQGNDRQGKQNVRYTNIGRKGEGSGQPSNRAGWKGPRTNSARIAMETYKRAERIPATKAGTKKKVNSLGKGVPSTPATVQKDDEERGPN